LITLTALRDESFLVDDLIDFVKANGKTAPKVHKPKSPVLSKGESIHVEKRHVFKANAMTQMLFRERIGSPRRKTAVCTQVRSLSFCPSESEQGLSRREVE
jgi:hypothetical protein